MATSYQDLNVWQLAMDLVTGVYEHTRSFPKHETYGLTIAEGKGRSSDRDRAHFFCHARGSLLELETQILIAQQLEYLPSSDGERLIANSAQLGRMLNALIQSLQDSENPRKSVA